MLASLQILVKKILRQKSFKHPFSPFRDPKVRANWAVFAEHRSFSAPETYDGVSKRHVLANALKASASTYTSCPVLSLCGRQTWRRLTMLNCCSKPPVSCGLKAHTGQSIAYAVDCCQSCLFFNSILSPLKPAFICCSFGIINVMSVN